MKQTPLLHKLSLATPREIGPWFIAALIAKVIIGIMAQPHFLGAV